MFFGPHKMKMSHSFRSLIPSGTWDFFDFRRPPPNFELFPTKTWEFFDFLTTPALLLSSPYTQSIIVTVDLQFMYFKLYIAYVQ